MIAVAGYLGLGAEGFGGLLGLPRHCQRYSNKILMSSLKYIFYFLMRQDEEGK